MSFLSFYLFYNPLILFLSSPWRYSTLVNGSQLDKCGALQIVNYSFSFIINLVTSRSCSADNLLHLVEFLFNVDLLTTQFFYLQNTLNHISPLGVVFYQNFYPFVRWKNYPPLVSPSSLFHKFWMKLASFFLIYATSFPLFDCYWRYSSSIYIWFNDVGQVIFNQVIFFSLFEKVSSLSNRHGLPSITLQEFSGVTLHSTSST